MKRCVFAGSFDPITNGHINIIEKCCKLFDEVIVALCVNPEKKSLMTVEERSKCVKTVCDKLPNAKFVYHDGLLVDLLKKEKIIFNVRGIRNSLDLEYENSMTAINKELYPELITVYLPSDKEFTYISSSSVKQLFEYGQSVEKYVPECVAETLEKKTK